MSPITLYQSSKPSVDSMHKYKISLFPERMKRGSGGGGMGVLTGDLSELSVLFRKIPRPSVAASENLPTPLVPQLESIRQTT